MASTRQGGGRFSVQDAAACKMDEIRLFVQDTFQELLEADKQNIQEGWQRESVRQAATNGVRFTEVHMEEDPINATAMRHAAYKLKHSDTMSSRRQQRLGSKGSTTRGRFDTNDSAVTRMISGASSTGLGMGLGGRMPTLDALPRDAPAPDSMRSIPRLPHESQEFRWSQTGDNAVNPYSRFNSLESGEVQESASLGPASGPSAQTLDQPLLTAAETEAGAELRGTINSVGSATPFRAISFQEASAEMSGSAANVEDASLRRADLPIDNMAGLKELFLQPIHCLLIVLPVVMGDWGFSPSWVFGLNLIGLMPLSQLLADATEQVAIGLRSAALGALLNATLGNATEMIVTVTSLRAGLYEVVKSAMLGSILSNLLAVLGVTIMAGALKYNQVAFGVHEPVFSVSLLLLGSMSFALPSLFFYTSHTDVDKAVHISRMLSVVTACTYGAYVYIQMRTTSASGEDEEALLTMKAALPLLAGVTYFIGLLSDALVDSISGLIATTPMSVRFVGVVLLPLAGNAQGALQGIALARRGGTNIAIALALSGCTQVALLVLPFAVLAGWFLDKPMDLKFDLLEVFVMILSVLVAFSIVVIGRAGWVHGLMLCSTYCTLIILFWSM